MAAEVTFTGNTRYRPQARWFGPPMLVLQIEVYEKGYYEDPDPHYFVGGRPYERTYFRDATVEDLSALKL